MLGDERIFVGPAGVQLRSERPLCFVLMPFVPSWSRTVYELIRKASIASEFDCLRADEIFGRDVIVDIWRGITSAEVIIADLTGRNANVLYEVGIGHTLGKPMILLAQSADDIPFDLATRRVIIYNGEDIEAGKLGDKIGRTLSGMNKLRVNKNEKDVATGISNNPGQGGN